jgi:hypothetical protein
MGYTEWIPSLIGMGVFLNRLIRGEPINAADTSCVCVSVIVSAFVNNQFKPTPLKGVSAFIDNVLCAASGITAGLFVFYEYWDVYSNLEEGLSGALFATMVLLWLKPKYSTKFSVTVPAPDGPVTNMTVPVSCNPAILKDTAVTVVAVACSTVPRAYVAFVSQKQDSVVLLITVTAYCIDSRIQVWRLTKFLGWKEDIVWVHVSSQLLAGVFNACHGILTLPSCEGIGRVCFRLFETVVCFASLYYHPNTLWRTMPQAVFIFLHFTVAHYFENTIASFGLCLVYNGLIAGKLCWKYEASELISSLKEPDRRLKKPGGTKKDPYVETFKPVILEKPAIKRVEERIRCERTECTKSVSDDTDRAHMKCSMKCDFWFHRKCLRQAGTGLKEVCFLCQKGSIVLVDEWIGGRRRTQRFDLRVRFSAPPAAVQVAEELVEEKESVEEVEEKEPIVFQPTEDPTPDEISLTLNRPVVPLERPVLAERPARPSKTIRKPRSVNLYDFIRGHDIPVFRTRPVQRSPPGGPAFPPEHRVFTSCSR